MKSKRKDKHYRNTLKLFKMNNLIRIIILIVLFILCLIPENLAAQGQISRQSRKPQLSTTSKSERKPKAEISISEPDGYINGYGYIDLGLPSGTKWATCNVGASCPEQEGKIFGWGDPTGEIVSEYSKDYPSQDPPMNICGDKRYDMAMVNMGYPWVLPSRKDLEELENHCKWETYTHRGKTGVRIIGSNGRSIFLPTTRHRDLSKWNNEKRKWENMETYPPSEGQMQYYSGELNSNGGQWEAWDSRPFSLIWFFGSNYKKPSIQGTGLRSSAYPVRACSHR